MARAEVLQRKEVFALNEGYFLSYSDELCSEFFPPLTADIRLNFRIYFPLHPEL